MAAETDMIGMGASLSFINTTNLWDGSTTVPTGTFGTIGALVEISVPERTADDVETTYFGITNSTKTFKAGLVDPGEVSGTIKYTDSTHDAMVAIFRTTKAWKLTFNDGSGVGFDGYIKSIGGEVPIDNLITTSFTIKLTNAVIDIDAV